MAFSKEQYTGTGFTTGFLIPYGYINQSFITVTLDGVGQVLNTDYTIDNSTRTVNFTVAPASSVAIDFTRATPNTEAGLVVNYSDGSGLTAADLNNSTTQLLHIIQEAIDANLLGAGSTELSEDVSPVLGGNLDANLHNIGFDDAKGLTDDALREWIMLNKATLAVNYLDISNAATGSGPEIAAAGDDSAVDLTLTPKGVGDLILDGQKWPQSDGTVNQILKTDGSGQTAWVSPGGGGSGSMSKIASVTFSTEYSVDIALDTTIYSSFILKLSDVTGTISDADLRLVFSNDGGSTYRTIIGSYITRVINALTSDDPSRDTNIPLVRGELSADGGDEALSFDITINDAAISTNRTAVFSIGGGNDNENSPTLSILSAVVIAAEENDYVRLEASNGDISGSYTLYGIKS